MPFCDYGLCFLSHRIGSDTIFKYHFNSRPYWNHAGTTEANIESHFYPVGFEIFLVQHLTMNTIKREYLQQYARATASKIDVVFGDTKRSSSPEEGCSRDPCLVELYPTARDFLNVATELLAVTVHK